jgi:hypothetical protein
LIQSNHFRNNINQPLPYLNGHESQYSECFPFLVKCSILRSEKFVLVEETGVKGKKPQIYHKSLTHWQTLSHNVVSTIPRHRRDSSTFQLKQQSAGRQVAPLGHIILIPSQPLLLFLLNTACLAEKQQIPIL